MKTLGVALAACCAVVLWPSVAHANPIGARDAAEKTRLATVPGSQAFEGDHNANDGVFTAEAGLDHSVHFAATGTIEVFDDDHASLGHVIDVDGLVTAAHNQITLALRTEQGENDNDGADHDHASGLSTTQALNVKLQAPADDPPAGGGLSTSANPEPAPMLLIATGLAGLVFYRRQLFA